MSYVHLTTSERVKIEIYLELGFAVRKIAGRLFQEEGLSFKTIYRWIYTGLVEADSGLLRQKGKRQKPDETRGRFNVGLPISKRQSDVKERQTFGHWELDTVVSGRGKSKARVAKFVERKSRLYRAVPINNRSAQSMKSAIQVLHLYFPSGKF